MGVLIKISVAMATYNGEKYLREQLDSIAKQTRLPDELVVSDDQSQDRTESIVKEFADRADFPVRFNRNKTRLRFASNFLAAANRCNGDYVMFCDQDDIWLPTKIEEVVQVINESGACLIAHEAIVFGEVERLSGIQKHFTETGKVDGSSLSAWNFFFGFVCTFRRSLLDIYPAEERPIDLIEPERLLSHDRWICFLASLAGDAYLIRHPLVYYRQHENNVSGNFRKSRSLREKFSAARNKFSYHLAKNYRVAQRCREIVEFCSNSAEMYSRGAGQARLIEQLRSVEAVERSYRYRMEIASKTSRLQRLGKILLGMRSDVYSESITGVKRTKLVAMDVVLSILATRKQASLLADL